MQRSAPGEHSSRKASPGSCTDVQNPRRIRADSVQVRPSRPPRVCSSRLQTETDCSSRLQTSADPSRWASMFEGSNTPLSVSTHPMIGPRTPLSEACSSVFQRSNFEHAATRLSPVPDSDGPSTFKDASLRMGRLDPSAPALRARAAARRDPQAGAGPAAAASRMGSALADPIEAIEALAASLVTRLRHVEKHPKATVTRRASRATGLGPGRKRSRRLGRDVRRGGAPNSPTRCHRCCSMSSTRTRICSSTRTRCCSMSSTRTPTARRGAARRGDIRARREGRERHLKRRE